MFLILRLESCDPKVTPVIGKVALDLLLKDIVNTLVIVKVLHGPKELGECVTIIQVGVQVLVVGKNANEATH